MTSAAALNTLSINDAPVPAFDYKSAVHSILPRLAATTHESDKLRRLSDDAANALRESGLSRMITPRQFGGYEMSPSAHIWACAEVGNVCSASSWVLMVCVAHDYIIGRFPEECQREVYEGDADNLVAGSLAPQGVITRVEGGWRLTGRWQFGSGSDHSPWFILGTKHADAGPEDYVIHHVMVPRADVVLDDTWHTLGMRGTGSKDIVVTDVFIPEHRVVPTQPTFLGLSPHAKAPTYRLSVYSGLPAMLSGSVLGMAEAGLKAFIAATATRTSPYGVVKAANPSMQKRVAESTAEVAAARRLLTDMCDRFDTLMTIDQPMSAADRIQMRWDAAYVVELSRRAIERLFASSGAHGLYEGNPVYRAFRDINTACHHAVIDFDTVSGMMGQFKLTGDLGENPRMAPFA
jgi:alkylation response protein AidB-like acyl-CoA dehydrogenase